MVQYEDLRMWYCSGSVVPGVSWATLLRGSCNARDWNSVNSRQNKGLLTTLTLLPWLLSLYLLLITRFVLQLLLLTRCSFVYEAWWWWGHHKSHSLVLVLYSKDLGSISQRETGHGLFTEHYSLACWCGMDYWWLTLGDSDKHKFCVSHFYCVKIKKKHTSGAGMVVGCLP